MAVIIDKELCIGCGSCAGACPQAAIDLDGEGKAFAGDACINCGMCIGACPVSAISAPEEEIKADKEWKGVWVFCQQTDSQLLPVSYELVGKGRELADSCGEELTAVVFGYNVWGLDSLIKAGADTVLYAEDRELSLAFEIPYASLMCRLINEKKPAVVLYGATPFGRTMAPMVAAGLRTGLTADCTVLEMDEETGLLKQTRPAFGGNLMATIVCADRRPQMATVRPGVFTAPAPDEKRRGRVEWVPWSKAADKGLKLLDFAAAKEGRKLSDFDVVVVAGRGIGQKKNLAVVKELAELLGGDFGVSRPLIDEGWAEYPHQVGQTGCSVAPKLLISLGVSGAIQHLAGISGAQTMIAVNTDPEAPIFSVADYAVVCDCMDFARAMIEELKGQKA